MTGEASINSTGYARVKRMVHLKEGKKQFTATMPKAENRLRDYYFNYPFSKNRHHHLSFT